LRTRETDDEVLEGNEDGTRRKRRHKVIIHSSPFLRCVQTSVAISAGLAQNPGHTYPRPSSSPSTKHSSPRIRSLEMGSPSLTPIPEPALKLDTRTKADIRKSTVRIDAFLGEWLSPDYFESITPPPSSVMMVAGAKADLLRNEDYTYLTPRNTASPSINQGFPGGWQSPTSAPVKFEEETPLTTLSSLAQALPRRDRTSSLSNIGNGGHGSIHRAKSPSYLAMASSPEHGVYQPPSLNYATSPVDPIPSGIVSHARDACVDVDYQWDSMRAPQQWGNGGEYGEEWSSMHKRFRTGFQKMNSWYQESEDPGKILTRSSSPSKSIIQTEHEDEDTDLVLVLVTHGAGCNALIGALTNQPVLLDVGLSSLTMAVRKPTPVNTPATTPGATPRSHSRANSKNVTVSDQYEVKLIANTEHLRNSSISTPASSRTPSMASIFREREGSVGSAQDLRGYTIPKTPRTASSGNFGSIRRAASVATGGPKGYTPGKYPSAKYIILTNIMGIANSDTIASQGSFGLWSAPATPAVSPISALGSKNEFTASVVAL